MQGHYCPGPGDGSAHLCPKGTYGDENQLSTSSCSGKCDAGYFCPEGSDNNQKEWCGKGLTEDEAGKSISFE